MERSSEKLEKFY